MLSIEYARAYFAVLKINSTIVIEQYNNVYPRSTTCIFIAWPKEIVGSDKGTVAIFKVKKKGGAA